MDQELTKLIFAAQGDSDSTSLNDYSRQDVKQAIRRIAKSVQTHTQQSGRRGYLDFIRQYVKG